MVTSVVLSLPAEALPFKGIFLNPQFDFKWKTTKGLTLKLFTVVSNFVISVHKTEFSSYFFVKRVPGQGPEQRESGKTVLYLLIVIIILISYIIIKLSNKRRTIPTETRNGTHLYLLETLTSSLIKVRLHWRDFTHNFALACTFSKENK